MYNNGEHTVGVVNAHIPEAYVNVKSSVHLSWLLLVQKVLMEMLQQANDVYNYHGI